MTAAAHEGATSLGRRVREAMRVAAVIIVPATIGGSLLAVPLMTGLFGVRYSDGALPLAILLWMVPLATYRIMLTYALTASGQAWALVRNSAPGALANVLLNVVLIPRYGMVGAAVTTVVAEAVVAIITTWQAREILRAMRPGIPWRLGASAIVMTVAVLAIRDAPLLVSLPVGGVAWLGAAFLTGFLDPRDLRRRLAHLRLDLLR
jgi:O-antigen/teichoic acid export membrane protein